MIGERKLLARLDQMLEDGINRTFAESDYDDSHQTKTPLANILLYTQLLEEQELDAQSRQLAEEIRAQAEKTAGSVTPFSIASGNMARSRKKTAIVVLSLTLSLVLANCLFTVLNSMDLDKYISHITIGDFVVRQPETGGTAAYDFRAVTPEQLAWLGGIEGVNELDATYYEPGYMKLSGAALERMEAFLEKYAETDQRGAFQEAAEGYVNADIYGIDADLLDELEILSGKVDPQEFAAGGYAVVYTRYVRTEEGDEALDDLYEPGDPVTIELTDGTWRRCLCGKARSTRRLRRCVRRRWQRR